ncbi:MAG: hypothetical protein NZ990_07895 [Myxococcota bacterium]|nr:hypothetical protein [Myxococcota bacterium]
MGRLRRVLLLVPAGIAFVYAAIVGADGFYVGMTGQPAILSDHGFDPRSTHWGLRSAGHYFWYNEAVAAVFALIGAGLRRLLRPKPGESEPVAS